MINGIIAKVFPERHICTSCKNGMRVYKFSSSAQALFACAVIGLIGLTGFLTLQKFVVMRSASAVPLFVNQSVLGSAAGHVRNMPQQLHEYQQLYEEMVEQLAQKSEQLRKTASNEAALYAQLDALQDVVSETAFGHEAVAEHLESVSDRTKQLTDELALARASEARLQQMLETVSKRLTQTAEERDSAHHSFEATHQALETLRLTFEVERRHTENLMRRLEDATRASMVDLEFAISRAGVDLEDLLIEIEESYSGSGGVFMPLSDELEPHTKVIVPSNRAGTLLHEMARVNLLGLAVERLPLGRPVHSTHRVSSRFGPRRDPFNQRLAMHKGYDLAAPTGTPILVTAPGRVVYAGQAGGYGLTVRGRHDLGFETTYAHLSRIDVKVGERTQRGHEIGKMGSTGRSSGPHLHYEIRRNGFPLDPEPFIEAGLHVF